MSKVLVEESNLSSIASAIRSKAGGSSLYKPSEMAAAIGSIPTGITPTGTINITQNGTTDVTQYASAAVNVPNSYSASDEGKVVSNGALVAQTARASTITQNGTYDTTENNSVTVNVGGGASEDNYLLKSTSIDLLKSGNGGYRNIDALFSACAYQGLVVGYNDSDIGYLHVGDSDSAIIAILFYKKIPKEATKLKIVYQAYIGSQSNAQVEINFVANRTFENVSQPWIYDEQNLIHKIIALQSPDRSLTLNEYEYDISNVEEDSYLRIYFAYGHGYFREIKYE